jgi:hypothetical protein
MIKNPQSYLALALPLIASLSYADTVNWDNGGGDSNWETATNWNATTGGNDVAPVGSGSIAIKGDDVFINRTDTDVVNVNNDISGYFGRVDVRRGTLNINAGGVLRTSQASSSEMGRAGITGALNIIGAAGAGNEAAFYVGHSIEVRHGGDFNITVGTNGLLEFKDGGQGGRDYRVRFGSYTSNLTLDNDGTFRSNEGSDIDIDGHSNIFVNDTATFEMTSGNYQMDGAGSNDAYNHKFSVNGSAANVTLNNVDAFVNNVAASTAFEFIADASGISTITVGTLDMDGTEAAGLIVDTTLLSGATQSLELFDYATIAGAAFSDVTLVGGNYTVDNIDYTGGDGSSIILDLVAIPEPGTFALLAGLSGLTFVAMRRRK